MALQTRFAFALPRFEDTPERPNIARAHQAPLPHCPCGCTHALADGTPAEGCDCYLTHPDKMY